jgi:hypothetical protein
VAARGLDIPAVDWIIQVRELCNSSAPCGTSTCQLIMMRAGPICSMTRQTIPKSTSTALGGKCGCWHTAAINTAWCKPQDVAVFLGCSTARGRSGRGRALLMLLPEELSFLKYLKVSFTLRDTCPALLKCCRAIIGGRIVATLYACLRHPCFLTGGQGATERV